MQVYQQLAPGFGDILPGNFVVPQNPISHPMAGVRIPHVGELMPARFAEPENPLLNALAGRTMPGSGGCGSCAGGMGALDLSSITGSVSSWASSQPWTTWAVIGAAAVGVFMLMGRGSSRTAYQREKREAMARLREKYPRRGRRMLEAAA